MHGLALEKYSTVFLNFKEINPWIVSENYYEQLHESALFIQKCHDLSKTNLNKSKLNKAYQEKLTGKLSADEMLHFLGIASKGNPGSPFISLKEWDSWKKESDLSLLTEKFYHPPGYLISGAGRHALTCNAHFKGIGRNILCTGEDYSHAWGGLLIKDALKGYLTGLYVSKRTILPQMANFGLFLYSQLDQDGVPLVLQIRESASFRLSQIYGLFEDEKELIKSHLTHFFQTTDPGSMLDKILEHYIHAYSVGVRHKSLSPDNLLIDGRWIDTESLDFKLNGGTFDEWLTVGITGAEFGVNITKYEPMSSITEDIIFLDSWIHQLHLMCKATMQAYSELWPGLNYDINGKFKSYLNKYFAHLDLSYWLSLLQKFDSWSGIKFGWMPQSKDHSFKADANTASTLKLRGYFYNTDSNLHNLTFGREENDSYEEMSRLTDKWEKAFWPQDLNWQSAHQLAEQIQRMVQSK